MTDEFIDITPSPQILSLITEIDVADHLCLAELIDNSLDNFQMTKNKKGEVKITFENIDDVEVCIVNVMKSSEPVYVNFKSDKKEYKGPFFRREGRSTIELNPEEVVKYIRDSRF